MLLVLMERVLVFASRGSNKVQFPTDARRATHALLHVRMVVALVRDESSMSAENMARTRFGGGICNRDLPSYCSGAWLPAPNKQTKNFFHLYSAVMKLNIRLLYISSVSRDLFCCFS